MDDDVLHKSSSASTSQHKRSPMSFKSVGGVLSNPKPGVPLQQLKDDDLFENTRVADLKAAFETAPKRAQNIVKILQNPGNLQTGKFKYMFFVGAPGTGKTTTAQAIAYTMVTQSGWGYKFMTATDIIGGFRNQAAERLRLLLEAIQANAVPILLIIDELNKVLDHSESKDHDNDTTSTVLWNFLDKQNYKKFFFIGLMNNHTKIPEALKSRVTLRSIEFAEIKDIEAKRNLLIKSLVSFSAQLHTDIKEEALNTLLNTAPSLSARDCSELAFRLSELSWEEHSEQTTFIITLEQLKAVFNEFSQAKKDIKRGVVEETNEERQERHHLDNLALQKNHFNMQQAQQDWHYQNSQEMQEKHFVLQYKMQKRVHEAQTFNFVQQQFIQHALAAKQQGNKLTQSDDKESERFLSDEQMTLYTQWMANTNARRLREEEEKQEEESRKEREEERRKRKEAAEKEYNAAKKSSSSWFGSWL